MLKTHFKTHDWTLTTVMLLFCAISITALYSATYGSKFEGYHVSMGIYYLLGFLVMFVVGIVDNAFLKRMTLILFGVGLLLLVVVLILDTTINNAKGWILIAGFSFQPAEIMKLFLVLMLARFIASRQVEDGRMTFLGGVLPSAVIAGVPFLLVLVQPDLGNAMAFVFIVVCLIWVGGMKYWQFLLMIGLAAGLLITSVHYYKVYHEPIEQYFKAKEKERWVERIDTFLYPDNVDKDKKYHIDSAELAIGSGSLEGEGYMQGTARRGFVPYVYADSIVVVIAEEFGFRGTALLLMLYMVLIYRIVLAAITAPDSFSRLLAIGIASMFLFQIFQNVGMHLRLMPLTGITLPFISYGGTSLLTNMIAVGIVQGIRAQAAAVSTSGEWTPVGKAL
ncbi:FtsW/RodA/SpoVE family cell cycle protein [Paenibacillus mucilaginosus]|uniref:Cell cycle protein n=1 Tax=Paenibacillus mucilaginosus (strain KNP414) TaxID=1036673 RepID=F8FEW2_PAEMK|nr:FtsW/RodA/SpoVE family cell cycle protein [Paenibacillus mucilaginosus]AEI46197.1 cell cycle protein [Paenibacillus mucilaginosus KNP414]MCG7213672.1 FtsW/RodA/SpoVE family cell cycle protein [Paenibacillus mucilaginosus]WDM27522.1 rod shape-determining protein RodA [Paenibacillus mucilaginosus]